MTAEIDKIHRIYVNEDGSPRIPSDRYINLPAAKYSCYTLRIVVVCENYDKKMGKLYWDFEDSGGKGQVIHKREWKWTDVKCDDEKCYADLTIEHEANGSMLTIFFEFTDTGKTAEVGLTVKPDVRISGNIVELDQVSMISVIPRLFEGDDWRDWERQFRGIKKRGYNCVHFTPIHVCGESGSPYSIYDHVQFDGKMFPKGADSVKEMVKCMEERYGLLAVCDMVWNHIAPNSEWLMVNADTAGYNVINEPHLWPALELDLAIYRLGKKMTREGVRLANENDLNEYIQRVDKECIHAIKLWEFYVMERHSEIEMIVDVWLQGNFDMNGEDSYISVPNEVTTQGDDGFSGVDERVRVSRIIDWTWDNAIRGKDSLGNRFHRGLTSKLVGEKLAREFGRVSTVEATRLTERLVDEINLRFYYEYDGDRDVILDELRNRIREEGFGGKNSLVKRYFTPIDFHRAEVNGKRVETHDVPVNRYLVNNGWVWGEQGLTDIAGVSSKAYLHRKVHVWEDCVKVRFGNFDEVNTPVWQYMIEYTKLMASIFHGFRIDNCHGMSLQVAERLLKVGRLVKQNILVYGEIFSGNRNIDLAYVKRLNLTGIIRAIGEEMDRDHLIGNLINEHEHETNDLVQGAKIPLISFDFTHDSRIPTDIEQYLRSFMIMCLNYMTQSAVGSVMGFDEAINHHIDIVHERRRYNSQYSTVGLADHGDEEEGISIGEVRAKLGLLRKWMIQEQLTILKQQEIFCTIHCPSCACDCARAIHPSCLHYDVTIPGKACACAHCPGHKTRSTCCEQASAPTATLPALARASKVTPNYVIMVCGWNLPGARTTVALRADLGEASHVEICSHWRLWLDPGRVDSDSSRLVGLPVRVACLANTGSELGTFPAGAGSGSRDVYLGGIQEGDVVIIQVSNQTRNSLSQLLKS